MDPTFATAIQIHHVRHLQDIETVYYTHLFLVSAIVFTLSVRSCLLGLVVDGMLLAESAILLHLETVRVILLVLHSVVISLLALRTSHGDFHAHNGTSLKNRCV